MKEVTKDRFKRLGAQRTREILKKLKILGNCANRYAYDYTEEDVKKIFDAIEIKVKEIKSKFYSELSSMEKEKEFKL